MYKNKKIKFRQCSEQEIEIYLVYEDFVNIGAGTESKEKVIGRISAPSCQGTKTSIQVCGISEAHTYWGCGNFGKPKVRKDHGSHKSYYYNVKGDKIMEQVRDIQLEFDEDTILCSLSTLEDCNFCFNTPCTCENKGDNIWNTGSPFNLKDNQTKAFPKEK